MVLGCQINHIQDDRINTAIKYISNLDDSYNVTWYLSGGVKNKLKKINSEAFKMKNKIKHNRSWNYVTDNKASNTAENFVHFTFWLDEQDFEIDLIIIITSSFHYDRSKKIADIIMPDTDIIWILGQETCSYCEGNEKEYTKNIFKDIENIKELSKN